jgi:hypothetical protein
MKKRAIYWMVPALALGLGACGKKEQTTSPEATSPAEKVVEAIAEAVTPDAPPAEPALNVDERAAKLGFVKHLPQDTEVVMAFHNGTKSAERITSSKIWGIVQDQMGMGFGGGEDFPPMEEEMEEEEDFALPDTEQDEDAEPEPGSEPDSEPAPDFSEDFPGEEMEEMEEGMGPAALFGTEFTIALGKSTGEQTGNLLTLNRRLSYFQMRTISKAFVSAAQSGDMSEMTSSMTDMYGPELFKDMLADSEGGVGLLEKLRMSAL